MSKILERAKELRAITERHYNCAQSVFLPFAEAKGVDSELANSFAANFGAGMKRGGTCGAITGGLMVLGLYGVEDPETIRTYHQRLMANHDRMMDCKDLLSVWHKAGNKDRKPHCDAMVYECVELCEELLREKGLL